MATSQVSLDQAPPLPPNLAQTQGGSQPSVGGLMGQPGSGGPQQGAVIQSAMQIEQSLLDLARMVPNFAPVSDQMIQLLRSGVQNSIQSQRSQGQPGSSPLGMPQSGIS